MPNNELGRQLLTRLKYAWKNGWIFDVGTSQTSGKSDVVVWSTIPHKTSLYGGPFGFPDPLYLDTCHAALNDLGVPNADACL